MKVPREGRGPETKTLYRDNLCAPMSRDIRNIRGKEGQAASVGTIRRTEGWESGGTRGEVRERDRAQREGLAVRGET